MDTRNNDLQTELSNTAELLAASTEARRMMADTIADLRTENATLRETVNALLTEIAYLRYGTRYQVLTDRAAYTPQAPERPLNGAVSDFMREGGEL